MAVINKFPRTVLVPTLGYEEDVGFVIADGDKCIRCGTAETAAALLMHNGVRHFDYTYSLVGHPVWNDFLKAAKAIGFEV